MTAEQFPPLPGYNFSLQGFKAVQDTQVPNASAWLRSFIPETSIKSGGYGGHDFYVEVLSPAESAKSWVESVKCTDIRSSDAVAAEIPIRPVGDGTKACRMVSDVFESLFLYTGTRNVGIMVAASLILSVSHPTDAEALETLAQLAERQLALIDQVAPPGPAMTATSAAPFQFTTPATLPAADAGKPYLPNGQPFSFCDPPTTGPTTPCPPPGSTARNPNGGSPPYHFQYGTAGGFPPFGLSLGKDGQLTGTPHAATAGKTYTFVVCAVDLKADFVCRPVSIAVIAVPTLTVVPSSAAAGAAIAVTGQNFTPNGTVSSLTVGGVSVLPPNPLNIQADGTFKTNVTVPAQLNAGAHTLIATDNTGRTATVTLNVVASAALTVDPSSAAAGAAIAVTGRNFTSNGTVRTLTVAGISVLPSSTIAIQADGTFRANITLPAQLTPGNYVVTAIDSVGKTANAPVAVTAPPATALAFAMTTATCRYLRGSPPYDDEYEVLVTGTASGPVDARLVLPGLSGYISFSWSSLWGNRTSKIVDRQSGDPATTTWTSRIVVGSGYRRNFPAGFTVDGYVTLYNQQTVRDSRVLTCALP